MQSFPHIKASQPSDKTGLDVQSVELIAQCDPANLTQTFLNQKAHS